MEKKIIKTNFISIINNLKGSYDKTIRIWNASTGECMHILNGHSDWVNSVAFYPKSEKVVSGKIKIINNF